MGPKVESELRRVAKMLPEHPLPRFDENNVFAGYDQGDDRCLCVLETEDGAAG